MIMGLFNMKFYETKEYKEKMSISCSGKNNGMYNKKQTEEAKEILGIFEGIVDMLFQSFPDEGIREILTRQYVIKGEDGKNKT